MASSLPGTSTIPPQPWDRKHNPVPATDGHRSYEAYRPCLRWEFAFMCPFCLLHEVQIAPHGAKTSGQFWLEHLETSESRPDLRSKYENIVYSCRRCNSARGIRRRTDAKGRRLLDPTRDIWCEHFCWFGYELRPVSEEGSYTAEAYDVNSPVKVALREERKLLVHEALTLLRSGPQMLDELMMDAEKLPIDRRLLRFKIASQLRQGILRARRALGKLSTIPHDADTVCRCVDANAHDLRPWIDTVVAD